MWVVLIGCPAALFIANALDLWGWKREEFAALVQAVGSVAAIFVAIWVATMQSRAQIKMARDSEREQLKKVVAVSKWVGTICVNALATLRQENNEELLRLFPDAIDNGIVLLTEISYERIPHIEASIGWIELRHAVVRMRQLVVEAVQEPEYGGRLIYQAELCLERAIRAIKRVETASTGHLPELRLDD